MSGRKKHRSANEYLRYLKGDLSGQERHSFERELETERFEKEALEGLEMLSPEQAEEDILALHGKIRQRLSRRRRIAYYSVAASIASLLIIGTVFMQIYDFSPDASEDTYQEEYVFEAPEEHELAEQEPVPSEAAPLTTKTAPKEQIADRAAPEKAQENVTGHAAKGPSITSPEEPSKGPARKTKELIAEEVVDEVIVDEVIAGERAAEPITFLEADAAPVEAEAVPVEAVAVPTAEVKAEVAVPQEPATAKPARDMAYDYLADEKPVERAEKRTSMRKRARSQEEYSHLLPKRVSGKVVSGEDMQPIPGATVMVKGSQRGVVTNMEGRFNLPVEDDSNQTLVASFVGMETEEYPLVDESEVELVMQPDEITLDEIVVIGQGKNLDVSSTSVQTVKLGDEESADSQFAQPAGGYKAFKTYIEKNIRFPAEETDIDRAVVVLRFTVTSEGKIRDIIPLRSQGELFTAEAARLLLKGPAWNPATDQTGSIEENIRLRIVFKR